MAFATLPAFPAIGTVTDSWFRTFKNFSDWLTTAGFPKTADTGQVDWTTVTAPGDGVQTAYEIRRFDDADQSANPIFLKIIFYYYAVSTTRYPALLFTVGTGSDGSGNLTGAAWTGFTNRGVNLSSITSDTRQWKCGADDSGFAVIAGLGPSSGSARNFFGIERPRNTDGNTVPRYLMIYRSTVNSGGGSLSPNLDVLDFTKMKNFQDTTLSVLYWKQMNSNTDSLIRDNDYVFGVLQTPAPEGTLRSKLLIGWAPYDFPDGTMLSVKRFSSGTQYTYLLENKDGVAPGGFGVSYGSSGANTAYSSPYYVMPAIYWQ